MSSKDATGLVIGGEPRIDFLPPEVKERKNARKTRRGLIALVIVVMVACAGGYVFATSLAVQAQGALADEQAKTAALLGEQSEYAEARTVSAQLGAVQDARLVATAKEILWSTLLSELRTTLPSGMSITDASVDATSAIELAPIASVPLEAERVATLTMTASAPNLPTISTWLDSVRDLRGFADVWTAPVRWEVDHYEVEIRLNLSSAALEKRFFEGYGEEEADAPEAGTAEEDPAEDATEPPEELEVPSPSETPTESEG